MLLFHSFKKVFNTLKENAVNGAEFKIEPIKEIPLSEPFNKKLFESLRKKHKV